MSTIREFLSMHLPQPLLILALATLLTACSGSDPDATPVPASPDADAKTSISGRLEEGLRVLTFDPARPGERFTIYRGDYVRPELVGDDPVTIEIPDLDVVMAVPVPEGERAYFKVPEAGTYTVRIGEWTGEIEAIEYSNAGYREVEPEQAARLMAEIDPFVLDVRTPREFEGAHLESATLIPVQVLANRLGELDGVRDRPVLVYCRSGNRSTVAAKMLVDAGFGDVINLRKGIVGWSAKGLPVVK